MARRAAVVKAKYEAPKCSVCGQNYKNYKYFPGGKMIRHICNCNQNLLDEETERIRKKYTDKMNSPDYKGMKLIEFRG